jgi:DNA mismatch endonuclease, patch repair protein
MATETRAMLPYPSPTSESASATMRGNRGSDTRPELAVRSLLHRRGHRFRKNLRIGIGASAVRPDIVFTRRRVAVFIDGCFWHCCPVHGTRPRSNVAYWDAKLRSNVERDERTTALLSEAGWRVVRVWEHETPENTVSAIEAALLRS